MFPLSHILTKKLHAALGPPIVEEVQNNEKADNKSFFFSLLLSIFTYSVGTSSDCFCGFFFPCADGHLWVPNRRTRRQSAIFETDDQETTEDSFEIKDDNKRYMYWLIHFMQFVFSVRFHFTVHYGFLTDG